MAILLILYRKSPYMVVISGFSSLRNSFFQLPSMIPSTTTRYSQLNFFWKLILLAIPYPTEYHDDSTKANDQSYHRWKGNPAE